MEMQTISFSERTNNFINNSTTAAFICSTTAWSALKQGTTLSVFNSRLTPNWRTIEAVKHIQINHEIFQ